MNANMNENFVFSFKFLLISIFCTSKHKHFYSEIQYNLTFVCQHRVRQSEMKKKKRKHFFGTHLIYVVQMIIFIPIQKSITLTHTFTHTH